MKLVTPSKEITIHVSAKKNAKRFFDCYTTSKQHYTIADIGSQDVNGSLKKDCPKGSSYTGIDFIKGKNVDVILDDPYQLPFEDNTFDIVICSSCFEHSDMFWLLFLEVLRILKPSGLFYLNTPSNGEFHEYPVDCWRFYPHSGTSLCKWGHRNGYNVTLLESYISKQDRDQWNDFIGVFLKDSKYKHHYPKRIISNYKDFYNGILDDDGTTIIRKAPLSEDQNNIFFKLKRLIWKVKNKLFK